MNATVEASPAAAVPAASAKVATFAQYELVRMLGHSSLTIAWQARHLQTGQEVRLLAAIQPVTSASLREQCVDEARRVARLSHPQLMPVREVGCHDRFPYVVCDLPAPTEPAAELGARGAGETSLPPQLMAIKDAVRRTHDVLEGLAYLHEAGLAHGDVAPHTLNIDNQGRVMLWGQGLAVALVAVRAHAWEDALGDSFLQIREVAAASLLLHRWLVGRAPMGQEDMPTLLETLLTTDIRLPMDMPVPVVDSLRNLVDRGCDLHPQRRYIHARSFERAVAKWQQTQLMDQDSFDEMFAERLRRNGHLPARPRLVKRVGMVAGMEQARLDAVVDVLLEDMGLSLALLRNANSPEAMALTLGEGVTSIKRALELMGTNGLRRVSTGLKSWPGVIKSEYVQPMEKAMKRAALAGHLAAFLVPAGVNAESALMEAQCHHLGRLLAYYHFPEEMLQIDRLCLARPTVNHQPPSEELAAQSVLGVDLNTVAMSFLKASGLVDQMRGWLRPISLDQPVHAPDQPQGWVKLAASCANEVLTLLDEPPAVQRRALPQLVGRYRVLVEDEVEVLRAVKLAQEQLARHLD